MLKFYYNPISSNVCRVWIALLEKQIPLGIDLNAYPGLKAWSERLAQRDSWQQTTPSPEAIQAALPNMRKILAQRF
jgi:glutathione S-transferase